MNFLKSLFKKQPIVQKKLNLGKITATIHFKDGKILEKKFEGEYYWSEALEFGHWFDHYKYADEKYQEFLNETNFVKVDASTLIPFSEIAKITFQKHDHFVETKRGQ